MTCRKWKDNLSLFEFFRKVLASRTSICILASCAIGVVAYSLFPFAARIPLRILLSLIIVTIVFVGFRRPANIQPATLTSIIALLVSYSALTQNISEWKEAKEAERPYFRLVNASIVKLKDEEKLSVHKFEFSFHNTIGQRAAHSPRLKAVIIDLGTGEERFISGEVSSVNDIPGDGKFSWAKDSLKVGRSLSTQVFGVVLVYSDPVLNKSFKQRYVMKWEKKGGQFKDSFNFETGDIPKGIVQKIDGFSDQFLSEVLKSNT
ncbi:MAG: hypothetical protein Q7J69_05170 [Candidatus Omnitrophota bacterium]|nr:hypothetical protein [Candidatus Omnitrophota bacterium]